MGGLCIVNIYVHLQLMDIDDMPVCLFNEPSVLVGDVNTRHVSLGSVGAANINGRVLVHFLGEFDDIKIMNLPTYVEEG